MGLHPDEAGAGLLHLVEVDDVLVGGAACGEGLQLVHLGHVLPEVRQVGGDVVVEEEAAGHADVLQLGHELGVEAAERVASQEPD